MGSRGTSLRARLKERAQRVADMDVAAPNAHVTFAEFYTDPLQKDEVPDWIRNMLEEKVADKNVRLDYEVWWDDGSYDDLGSQSFRVVKSTEKALKIKMPVVTTIPGSDYHGEWEFWMPKSAFETVTMRGEGGKSVTKFASQKSKERALGDIQKLQTRNTMHKKSGGIIKGKKGAKYDIIERVSGTSIFMDQGMKVTAMEARHNFVVTKAKEAGIKKVKVNSSQATIIKQAREQGKWGEISQYFKPYKNSYSYNATQIGIDLAKDPKLAVKIGVIPEDY